MSSPEHTLELLTPPSHEAAEVYARTMAAMTVDVDRELADTPENRALIGDNPLRLMFDNHRNHAQFVANVMRYGSYALLLRTMPWVYRAYISQGFSPTYFVVELRAWRSAIQRHIAPKLAEQILPLYDWLLAHHDDWLQQSRQRPASALEGEPRWQAQRQTFFAAVRGGDATAALSVARGVDGDLDSVMAFFEEVVQPAMAEIGLRWESGELSPAHEHRATSIAVRTLLGIQPQAAADRKPRGTILVGAAPNEYHELGAQMLAVAFELDGWRVSYLGADTPEEDVVALAVEDAPDVIAISVAMPYNLERAANLVTMIRDEQALNDCRVMVGGQAFRDIPEIGQSMGANAVPSSLREAISQARMWSCA